MRWMPTTLRARLLLAAILVEVAAFAVVVPATLRIIDHVAARVLEQRLSETVPVLSEALARPLFQRDLATLQRIIGHLVGTESLAAIEIFDATGKSVAKAESGRGAPEAEPDGVYQRIRGPIRLGGVKIGTVEVLASTAVFQAARRRAVLEGLVIAGVQIVGTALVLALIALFLTRNLARLQSTARAVTAGQLTRRAGLTGSDEVAQTAAAFDAMLDALQASEQWIGTIVSHTPIIVFSLDPAGMVTFAAGHGLEAIGLSSDQVVGQDYFAVVADSSVATANMRRALAGEQVENVGDFGGRTFRSWLQPLLDEQGRVTRVLGLSMDISEVVRAEQALRISEARFRDFARASSDWLWETDAEHRLSFLSPEFTRITGEPTEAYLGRRREEMAAGYPDQAQWKEYQRLLAAHLPIRDFAFRLRAPASAERTLRINGLPVFDEAGRFTGYRGTATDISEQMRMQSALQSGEARFRNLVEGSLQGVLVLDRDWHVIFANQAAADIYGYASPEELMALPSGGVLVAPEDRARLRDYNEARLGDQERPTRYEHRGLRKDGRVVWLQTFARIVDWEGVQAVQATLVDITDQKAAEEEQRRSEQNFRSLIEGTGLATALFDEDWHIVFVNRAAASLFGYDTPQSLIAAVRSGAELVYEEDRAMVDRYRTERLAGAPAPLLYEFRGVRRDGQLVWLQNISSVVEWQGRPASMSITQDVTANKLREEELRQALKMEVVGQLTGGVAHDFNNLLTVIMGNLELLRRRIGQEPRALDLLASASRAAERGATLTQRLLAFSRRQALKPEAVDVNRLITGMADLLSRTLGETIEVETVLAGGLWQALVDPNQLENTLLNLAINARDAMPGGGKLTIETANARLDDEYAALHEEVRPGQYVMMAVSDTGEGMTPDVLERAFEPFFTTKEVGRGSGLGLSMIYGFVKQSGGHVKIYSEPGQGTTVKVYLPRQAAPDGGRSRPAALRVNPQGQGETILVVEDDRAVCELAMAILANLGYTAIAANDGAAALEVLAEHPDTALLFTDVVLTGSMSGVELAREARRRWPALKVLYTSGYTENAIIHHGRLDEGVELLEKPYRIETLARKLRAVLDTEG
jgi:PAS domain S-box-containing protein